MLSLVEEVVRKGISRGLSEVEVYAVKSTTWQFTISHDKVIEVSYREDQDLGIRGSMGKKVGGLKTNSLENTELIVDRLVSIVKSSPEDPYWSGFPPRQEKLNPVKTFDEKAVSRSVEEYVEILKYIMDKFKEVPVLRGVEKAVVTEGLFTISKVEVTILNSSGMLRQANYSPVTLWLELSVEKGGLSADKGLVYSRSVLDEKLLEKTALVEGERALLFFDSKPVESGTYDIVLEPSVAGEVLLYSLAPAFSALNILENRSPVKDKLGQEILSDKITILDNPSVETATGTRPFDDEGVATSTKPVVERGVFKTILHSYYTSRRMNAEPTGNGIRSHPASQPIPSFTNFVVKPGKGSLEEFAKDVRRGIVVYEVIGHWMSDPTTGSIKATVTHGLLVENGEVVKPVKGVVLGGSVYEWLSRNLVEVGGDTK